MRCSFPGYKSFLPWLGILLLGSILLTGCGGSSVSGGGTAASTNVRSSTSSQGVASDQRQGGQSQSKSGLPTTEQYLVKTLKLSMQVKDTRKVAADLRRWISTTDTRSLSTGTDYEPAGNNLYTISLTFSVQSSLYPQIYTYLRDYSAQNGGRLSSFTETVQDMTNDYVDTQSRLKSLRTEQTRLLDLMSHAQAIGDVVAIEQKLTDVEGQLETFEGRLKRLDNQTSFYTVQIYLEPVETNPQPTEAPWSLVQVFQQAFNASIVFAQVLLTFLVWVLAFAWYAIPVVAIIWLIRRLKFRAPWLAPAGAQKTSVKS